MLITTLRFFKLRHNKRHLETGHRPFSQTKVPALAVTMFTDENMLRQVLINLVKNACEAGATTMDVRWYKELWISNNGAPIPADVEREIFVPFFTTKKNRIIE